MREATRLTTNKEDEMKKIERVGTRMEVESVKRDLIARGMPASQVETVSIEIEVDEYKVATVFVSVMVNREEKCGRFGKGSTIKEATDELVYILLHNHN
jgi:hypothetical protein